MRLLLHLVFQFSPCDFQYTHFTISLFSFHFPYYSDMLDQVRVRVRILLSSYIFLVSTVIARKSRDQIAVKIYCCIKYRIPFCLLKKKLTLVFKPTYQPG